MAIYNIKDGVKKCLADVTPIGEINTKISAAVTAASTAQSTADTAVTNAATAQSTANSAAGAAQSAQNTADQAIDDAAKALTDANNYTDDEINKLNVSVNYAPNSGTLTVTVGTKSDTTEIAINAELTFSELVEWTGSKWKDNQDFGTNCVGITGKAGTYLVIGHKDDNNVIKYTCVDVTKLVDTDTDTIYTAGNEGITIATSNPGQSSGNTISLTVDNTKSLSSNIGETLKGQSNLKVGADGLGFIIKSYATKTAFLAAASLEDGLYIIEEDCV